MSEIPEDIRRAAETVDAGFFSGHRGLYVEDIAHAIMAERERCARFARKRSQRYSAGLGDRHCIDACQWIENAIRSPAPPVTLED